MKYFFPNEFICGSSITSSLYMYISKFKKKHDFARLIFYFEKFQEIETKAVNYFCKKAPS